MDSQHNRKGFIKGKLLSFTRASKSSSNLQYSSRMRPNLSSASVPSITYLVDHQDFNPQPRQKVSLFVPEYNYKSVNEFESYFSTVDDENVNMKAANYISSVRERIKLERINSERNSSLELI
ncbi:uncharacterized protein LOC110694803 [Chenopodium quinoa]|uniref:uncharacterized protein LOC110694803 n=1 Tax=Chenopodium quinoa TaxID=63459 RepID=UPI000B78B768|nr:uncharacterized protein LOC110694803 [Chenopodium quinoa]